MSDENRDDEKPPEGAEASARSSNSDSLIGATLGGRYVILKLLGRGGMGAVYSARQSGLERDVAIKVLRPEVADRGVEVERFRREALATAQLQHPNIVKVYDFDTTPDGRAFLVMELLGGPSLAVWNRRNPYPAPSQVVDIFKPVAAAVDAMHRAGIIHRDIKPSNIALPDPDDPDDLVKILDLGIVRFSDTAQDANLTGRLVIGTVEYIAPEVATGSKATSSSDLYALGVTAYQTLVGDLPFRGATPRDVLVKHVKEAITPPSKVRNSLPAAVDDVFLRALAKDPAKRYPSAREFIQDLERALGASAVAHRASILVVENDQTMAEHARSSLERRGYAVTVASDGFEALMLLGGRAFEVIVSNLTLPDLDGPTFLRLAAEKGVTAPVIAVARDAEAALLAPPDVDAVLALPLSANGLAQAVSRALDKVGLG
jgi:serine/threonine protein kinase